MNSLGSGGGSAGFGLPDPDPLVRGTDPDPAIERTEIMLTK
jgi:hypothetical protein